ncbi:MAG: ATP-dependent Clp protease proteolytic subunit [Patescibacteria group bacterium]
MKKNNWVAELFWIYGISGGSAILVGYFSRILEINGWGYATMLAVYFLTAIISLIFVKFWKENKKYAVSFNNREVFLDGKIDNKKCAIVFFQILRLNHKGNEPIKMFVDSIGGELDGFNILTNAIKSSEAPITGIVIGRAYSAAAIALQCCHKRLMFPNSKLLLHTLQCSGSVSVKGYNAHENVRTAIKSLLEFRKKLFRDQEELDAIVLTRSGLSMEKLESIEDKELTPDEALKLNLIDEIIVKL